MNSAILGIARHKRQPQRGVALVVSLVLLIALTVVGVALLSATRIDEQNANNEQHKAQAFKLAESGIASVLDKDYLLAAITSNTSDTDDTGMEAPVALVMAGQSLNMSGSVAVQYCGETMPIGTDLNADLSGGQLASILLDINAIASVDNTSTTADHVQRVAITALQTNRRGKCQVR